MGSGICLGRDYPEQYRDIIDIMQAKETTIVDAVLTGTLEQRTLDKFLEYVAAADQEVDPEIIHLIKIVDALLEEHNA